MEIGRKKICFDLNPKIMNPVGHQLLRFMTDPAVRLIICYGGSSSGKSYSLAQAMLALAIVEEESSLVMRKVGASISKTIYEDFKQAASQMGVRHLFRFVDSLKSIRLVGTRARIDFTGLDDPEKIKGISNYKRVCMDELNEFDLADFKQIRKRLRGKKGQQIIGMFNPIEETHWIKKELVDPERWNDIPMGIYGHLPEYTAVKSLRMNSPKPMVHPRTGETVMHDPDTVLIQSTYLNNFWVVGSPDGTFGFYDEQCVADFEKDRVNDPDMYNVYALGEWGVIRKGSEFFGSFSRGLHCAPCPPDPDLPLHICVDSNVLPYITVTFWQCEYPEGGGIAVRQVGELCAGNPDNTVRRAARIAAERVHASGCAPKVYLHGDASTRSANNIDDEKRSFLDLFISTLAECGVEVTDCVGRSNPSVPMSGEFVNAVWEGQLEGLSITIGEDCTVSVEDYLSVQKDANGGIHKKRVKDRATGQTYEEYGHASDCLRYAVCDLMREEFLEFSNRRKRNLYARGGFISFFNSEAQCAYSAEMAYCIPDMGGKFALLHGKLCGDRWHILSLALCETSSTEEMKARIAAIGCPVVHVETGRQYYPMVRELRSSGMEVRVIPEDSDPDSRIKATSDFVRAHVLFDPGKAAGDQEYSAFIASMLDYNKDSRDKCASAALSGFCKAAIKKHPLAV